MPDELGELLAAGEHAAFHGRPDAGVAPLTRAIEVATITDRAAEAAGANWLLGVCLGAAGRYGRALEVLGPVVTDVSTPESKVFASLAGATVASLHRQLGRHEDAAGYDEAALAVATEVDSADGRFDAVLGLAADAVGLNDAATAGTRLAEAAAHIGDRSDWWRQRVRLGWVRAEVALLRDSAAEAVGASLAAVELAEHSGAPRHVAKGLLFVGVSQVEAHRPASAAATLRRAALLAESLGTLPLQWPVRAVLGTLVAGVDDAESDRCLAAARRAVETIAAGLPEPLQAPWLARPDIAALREGQQAGEV